MVSEIIPKAKTSLINRSTKKKTDSLTALRRAFANYCKGEWLLPVPLAGTAVSEKSVNKWCIFKTYINSVLVSYL